MDWLNYHHLYYFWVVAREGTITRACERLMLSQPAITTQLRALERAWGHKLFERVGRRLHLTEMGKVVYQYADEIFTVGQQLVDVMKSRSIPRPAPLAVGIDDILPKMVVYRLLEPVLSMPESFQLVCQEDNMEHLLSGLAVNELDLVLSDSPVSPAVKIRAFNHLLGRSGIVIMGTKKLADRYRRGFPGSMNHAPLLLPMANTNIRRSLDQYFSTHGITPAVKGEFDDTALMELFGRKGTGLVPIPAVVEKEVRKMYRLDTLGILEGVAIEFYVITTERRIRHPAVVTVFKNAEKNFFTR